MGYWIEALEDCDLIVNSRVRSLSKGSLELSEATQSGHRPPAVPLFVSGSGDLIAVPEEFCLKQNYPNPFNPETTIEYGLPESCDVDVRVYNIGGAMIRELERGHREKGWHRLIWDGRTETGTVVSSGVYLIEVTAGVERDVIKTMFLK